MSQPGSLRLSVGMVGGGPGSNIGAAHRAGLRIDDRYRIDAGCFARDHVRSSQMGASLGIASDRIYRDYKAMASAEAAREDGIDLVVILTPNDTHAEIASAFIDVGIAVACEKPLAQTVAEATSLVRQAETRGALLAVAHCYSAYAMIRQAARMVRDGELGRVRHIEAEHASGWAASLVESTGQKQASWRTDPAVAGRAAVVADIGIHAFHLMRYVTGLEAESVSAQLTTLVPGRRVADNAIVTLRFQDGVPGRLWASMAATGNVHGLLLRVFGDRASLEWRHDDPQRLLLRSSDGRETRLVQGMAGLSDDSLRLDRIDMGHPEGFIEAFGNFYSDIADELIARRDGRPSVSRELSFPTGMDGLIGLQLVEAVDVSDAAQSAWVDLDRSVEAR